MIITETDDIDTICCLHVDSVTDSPLIRFNWNRWKEIRVCAVKWLQLDVQKMKDIADRLANGRHDLYSIASFTEVLRFHPALSSRMCHVECYKRFTDQEHIQQLMLQSGGGDNDIGTFCKKIN